MGQTLDSLPGTVILLGEQVRDAMARAMENDDLSKVREILKEADQRMGAIVGWAKQAQAEIDGSHDA